MNFKIKFLAIAFAWIYIAFSNVASADELNSRVQLKETFKTNHLTGFLREAQRQTPITFNIEIIRPQKLLVGQPQEATLSLKNPLTAKTYTISQLLTQLKQQVPMMQWQTSQSSVNVVIPLTTQFVNPLDTQIKTSGKMALSPQKFLDWLNSQSPKATITARIDFSGFLNRTEKVNFRFSKGMTLRQILNLYAQNSQCSWEAQIYKRQPETISAQDDKGKTIFSQLIPGGVQAELVFIPTSSEHRHQRALLKQKNR